jgi:hypothetical protein
VGRSPPSGLPPALRKGCQNGATPGDGRTFASSSILHLCERSSQSATVVSQHTTTNNHVAKRRRLTTRSLSLHLLTSASGTKHAVPGLNGGTGG